MRMLSIIMLIGFSVVLSADFAKAQTLSADSMQTLKRQIGIRLERTSPVDAKGIVASDRGGDQIAKEFQSIVDTFRTQMHAEHFADAKQTVVQLFDLIPQSERAFSYLLPAPKDIKNAPTTVIAIRRAFYDIGRLSVDNAEVRALFLEKSNQLFERNIALAANGKRFLELFGLLTGHFHELAAYEKRLTSAERAALGYNRQVYDRAFAIMQTAERTAPVAKAVATPKTCPSLFSPALASSL